MKSLKRLFLIGIHLILMNVFCFAQQEGSISGKVLSRDEKPLAAATLTLKDSATGGILSYAISTNNGTFFLKIKNVDTTRVYVLIAGHIQTFCDTLTMRFFQHTNDLVDIQFLLKPNPKQLQEVIIKSAPQPFSLRGDTIDFKADAYKTPETRKVQDVLKNIQGFSVGNDGKISFNGKTLDKILIDGEDLAEKNYTLISRNLNADIVSRIQVLNNFNDDRLMKEVENSGKVGINLVTDSSYHNRISGTVEMGSGPEKKIWIDNNIIWLTRKIKILSFINFNDISRPGTENLDYYFNQDMPVMSGEKIFMNGIVNTAEIYPPDIGQAYTRNNRDFSASALSSFKTGEFVKWKVLISGGNQKLVNRSDGYQNVFLTDSDKWTLYSNEAFTGKRNERIVRVSMVHDSKRNNNGSWSLQMLTSGIRNNYLSSVTGVLQDTLSENLQRNVDALHLNGYETFRLNKNSVLKLSSRTAISSQDEHFQVHTSRFQDYFQTDPGFRRLSQFLKENLFRQETEIRVSSRWKTSDLAYGLRSAFSSIKYNIDVSSRHIFKDSLVNLFVGNSGYRSFFLNAYGMLTRKLSRKAQITGGGSFGMGSITVDNITNIKRAAPVFQLVAGYEYRFKPLIRVSADYKISQSYPVSRYFFPETILSGNVSIRSPAKEIIFPVMQNWSVSYVGQNLFRGTGWQIMASYNIAGEDYISSHFLRPEYSCFFYVPVKGNRQWHLMTGTEKYHQRMKIKTILQTSIIGMKNRLFINNLENLNQSRYIRTEGKLISALKSWFNMELSSVISNTINTMTPQGSKSIRFAFWQFQGSVKVKSRFTEKFYTAIWGNFYNLATTSTFHSIDAYASYTLSPQWLFTLNVHNLLNASSIIQRYTSLNSESEQRFNLVGRYIMVKLAWNF